MRGKQAIRFLSALATIPLCAAVAQSPPASPGASAQVASKTGPPGIDTRHCQVIAAGDPQLSLLPAVCEFALTYRRELPDFICEQTTTTTARSTTVMKAEVTFEKGQERHSKVTVDGRAFSLSGSDVGFISAGELGSDLFDLFTPLIVAEFRFRKEAILHNIPSLVYEFHIAQEKNKFWTLRDDQGVILHPEYEGELWLERQSGRLLRLQQRAMQLPRSFGFATVDVRIDYSEIPIGGLGVFLLPSRSETAVCSFTDSLYPCKRNTVVFHNCRKFATKTRIISDKPPHSEAPKE